MVVVALLVPMGELWLCFRGTRDRMLAFLLGGWKVSVTHCVLLSEIVRPRRGGGGGGPCDVLRMREECVDECVFVCVCLWVDGCGCAHVRVCVCECTCVRTCARTCVCGWAGASVLWVLA